MLTPIGSGSINSDKTVYNTLTRLAHNNDQFMEFYKIVLSHFNWTDVTLIYDDKDYVSILFGRDIMQSFPPAGVRLSVVTLGSFKNAEVLRKVLKAASSTSRGEIFPHKTCIVKPV